MNILKLTAIVILLAATSCNSEGGGPNSTPIDSTNKVGTQPGAYDANPAKDSAKTNYADTGTNAKNTYSTPAE
jgi:hypothetical protein